MRIALIPLAIGVALLVSALLVLAWEQNSHLFSQLQETTNQLEQERIQHAARLAALGANQKAKEDINVQFTDRAEAVAQCLAQDNWHHLPVPHRLRMLLQEQPEPGPATGSAAGGH